MAQETPPSGEAIYPKHCAECHGDKGQADCGRMSKFPPKRDD